VRFSAWPARSAIRKSEILYSACSSAQDDIASGFGLKPGYVAIVSLYWLLKILVLLRDGGMSAQFILSYLGLWSLLGATLFSVFVVFMFKSGLVYSARKADGTLKDKIPLRGYLVIAAFLLSIVAFLVVANFLGLAKHPVHLAFPSLFGMNFGLYIILFLFDTLFIDGFMLGTWRPGFLHLPVEMGRESMREHMTKSIPVGILSGLIIAALSSVISFYTVVPY
jgi:hypothetical protein